MEAPRPTTAELAAARFRKSSYSGPGGNECVECAPVRSWTSVRDSKLGGGPTLVFPSVAFGVFLDHVKTADQA